MENRKVVLISYADERMSESLKQLGKQARKTGIFDEVILYTPKYLPQYVKDNPLMKYQRGGGYWCWKPALIYETLQRHEEGTVVVYVDAGCTIRNFAEWRIYFRLMDYRDTIVFQYPPVVEAWAVWGQTSTEIKYWTKRSCLQFMDSYISSGDWHSFNKCMGGFLFFKGKENAFLKAWMDITQNNWPIVMDPAPEEMSEQIEGFAYHKHEQSIITPLAYKYHDNTFVLRETCESCGRDVALHASRIRAKTVKEYYTILLKQRLREKLGDKIFDSIKRIIKK